MKARSYLSSEVAVLLSLLLHTLAFVGWENRHSLPILRSLIRRLKPVPVAAVTPPRPTPVPTITFVQAPPEPPRRSEPRQFIETDPSQVTGETPQNARFYSDNATVAANPHNPTGKLGDTPYLEGTETRVLNTVDSRPGSGSGIPAPPPAPAPPPTPAVPKPEEPPKKIAEEGLKVVEEMKVAKLETPVAPPPPPPPPVSPGTPGREIAAAKSKLTTAGIQRTGIAAFNVASSPFGAYDKALIRAVQIRWYALMEQNRLYDRSGEVVVQFFLHSDGSVHDVRTTEKSAGEILALFCEKAIVESAPFAALPDNLRALIGDEPREINFTFYY